MTRENILAKLKNKYQNLGLGDEILGVQSDSLLSLSPTDENIDSLIDGVEPFFKSIQSTLDKARAKAKTVEPVKPLEPAKPAQPTDEMPSWAKALSEKLDSIQNKEASKTKTENLIAKLNEAKVPEKFYSRFLKAVDFNEEYDEEGTVENFKADYGEFKQQFANEGAMGLGEPIQTPQKQALTTIDADIERLA